MAISRGTGPLPPIAFPVSLWTPHQVVAAALSAVGVLVIAVVLGYVRGRVPAASAVPRA